MKIPFISRAAYESAQSDWENKNWILRKRLRALEEREAARIVCCDVLSQDAEESRREREKLESETQELKERLHLLLEDNRELRRRYDTARAELARTAREVQTLRLMKASLEARIAKPSEIDG